MNQDTFSEGQIQAMKIVIAVMLDRAHDRDFEFENLGMKWLGAMNTPAVLDEDGQIIMVQDLFDASLVVAWSAVSHLARALDISVDEVIQSFAMSVAEAELEENLDEEE